MEGDLLYQVGTSATNTTRYYNLVRDLSIMNSRNVEHTTRSGVPLVFVADIRITCEGAGSFFAWTVPETWKARNAGVKWHKLREKMFRDAGISKKDMGRYGKTIRPYFSPCHKTAVLGSPAEVPLPAYGGITDGDGACTPLVPVDVRDNMFEWTYSDIVVTPEMDDGGTVDLSESSVVDVFDLSILGDHQITAATATEVEKWSNVGMIKSYLEDREGALSISAASVNLDSKITPGNPLALLRSLSTSAGEITEVAEDQQDEQPPYQTGQPSNGFMAYQADFSGCASTGPSTNTAFNPTITLYNVRIPYGILAIRDETTDSLTCLVDIKVKRIEEM